MQLLQALPGCGAGGGVADGGLAISGPAGILGGAFTLIALCAVWVAWRRSGPPPPTSSALARDEVPRASALAEKGHEMLEPQLFVPDAFLVEAHRAPTAGRRVSASARSFDVSTTSTGQPAVTVRSWLDPDVRAGDRTTVSAVDECGALVLAPPRFEHR